MDADILRLTHADGDTGSFCLGQYSSSFPVEARTSRPAYARYVISALGALHTREGIHTTAQNRAAICRNFERRASFVVGPSHAQLLTRDMGSTHATENFVSSLCS